MEPETERSSAGFSLQDYLAILRRRRAVIAQAFILVSVLGIAQALMEKNVYESSAKLLVDGPSYNLNTIDAGNPLSSLFEMNDQQTVDTQVVVLQAQPLLDEVRKEAGPASLSVSNIPGTNVIEVSGESSSPQSAAEAPNTLLKLFIDRDLASRLGEMEQARQFVQAQGRQAHDRLHATENALKAFKQKTHLVELVKDRDDQIALVTTLAASRQKSVSDLAGLRAQVASDQDEMSREPAETASETQAPNPVVAGANESIRTLEVQRVGLIQPGGLTPKAPQVRALDAQIAALQARLMIQPLLATTWTSAPNLFRIALQEKIADLQAQVPVTQTEIAMTGSRPRPCQASSRQLRGAGTEFGPLHRRA